jgi:hypothetical protein
MLIVFKSKASGDVMMFGEVALQLLNVMGKGRSEQGIITVEQMPDTIARLKRAMAENKVQQASNPDADDSAHEPARASDRSASVSLAVRAVPLLELLERSHKAKVPVLWGR